MEAISIKDLRESTYFKNNILWETTPVDIFGSSIPGHERSSREDMEPPRSGFLFYVDIFNNKPCLAIMKTSYEMTESVAYVEDIPDDLLQDSLNCPPEQSIDGMYPLADKLREWLKNQLNL